MCGHSARSWKTTPRPPTASCEARRQQVRDLRGRRGVRGDLDQGARQVAGDAHPAGELQHVLEALVGHQHHARALPLEQRIGGHGGAVDQQCGGRAAGEKLAGEYRANRYHGPKDEYDPSWNWAGVMQDLQLFYRIGRREFDGPASDADTADNQSL